MGAVEVFTLWLSVVAHIKHTGAVVSRDQTLMLSHSSNVHK